MAIWTLCRSLLVALGVSVLAGAAQLGVAYGLGILRLARPFTDGTVDQWPAQLAWVAWYSTLAAVTGAVLADRYARRSGLPVTTAVQVPLAVAATLGATVVTPLCTLPARQAQIASVEPVLAVAVHGLAGALAGTVAAVVALRWAPAFWNLATFCGALWFVGLLSVVPSLGPVDPLPAVRLGALDPASLAPDTAQRLAMLVMPGLALVVGAAVAGVARWRGQCALVCGASATAGPLVAAIAYVAAGPGSGGDRYQSIPYWAALLSIATGALGGTAATVLRWPVAHPSTSAPSPVRPSWIPPARLGRSEAAATPQPTDPHPTPDAPTAPTGLAKPPTPVLDWTTTPGDGGGTCEIIPPALDWSMPSQRPAADAGPDEATETTDPSGGDPEEPRGLRSLLQRGRSWIGAAGGPGTTGVGDGAEPERPPVPPHDEEYVDWVTGLGEPMPDRSHDPEQPGQNGQGSPGVTARQTPPYGGPTDQP